MSPYFQSSKLKNPRTAALILGACLLLIGILVRSPTLVAGAPYLNYVDEGHLLHPVKTMVATGSWDPDWYLYPALPFVVTTAAANVWRAVQPERWSWLLQEGAAQRARYYDLVEPYELILAGRLTVLLFSVLTLVLIAVMARRLAGERAGLIALWFAVLLPALVVRSSIVTVDMYAAFFTLLALEAADRARRMPSPSWTVLVAGVAIGFAATSKYPAVVVSVAVVLCLAAAPWSWMQRLMAIASAGVTAILAGVMVMPSLVMRHGEVRDALVRQAGIYAQKQRGSYLGQAFQQAEWDQPLVGPELGILFVLLAVAGLVVLFSNRLQRFLALSWLLYGTALLGLFLRYGMRPFRNLLPLAALGCVLVGVFFAYLRRRSPRPLVIDAVAVLLPLVLFSGQVAAYCEVQWGNRDSRTEVVDWLSSQVPADSSVAVLESLAFVDHELARIGAEIVVGTWPESQKTIAQRRPRFIVTGKLADPDHPMDQEDWQRILGGYELRVRLGSEAIPPFPAYWHGNRQQMYVFERL